MNRRTIKKAIKTLADELVVECGTYLKHNAQADRNKVIGLIDELRAKEKDTIRAINTPPEGDANTRVYYKNLLTERSKELIAVLDKLEEK